MTNIFEQPTDQDALTLTHAIALAESGKGGVPNYNAVGDNGTSHGAYQWQPGNFESAAKQYGLDPNDRSPTNQDKVAYAEVKAYKDKGYDPGQIASLWNSGSPNNWQNHSGTTTVNGKPLAYDTPAYVNKVKSHYLELKGGPSNQSTLPQGTPAPVQFNPQYPQTDQTKTNNSQTPDTSTLGGKLGGRIQDASNAISDTLSGKQGVFSGVLQTVGAGAGGVGDVVTSAIEHTPILGGLVKSLENTLGSGVTSYLNTGSGKGLLQGVSQFSKDHPELSKDIGAGINIVSAIPILKGIGLGVNVAKDAAASALKGVAEKAATEGLSTLVSSTKTGAKALARNPDAIKTLVSERAIPDIIDGKYSTKDAFTRLQDAITHIDENELQPVLDKASTGQVANHIPLETYKNQAMADAVDQLKDTAPVEAYFKRLQAKYGDFPTLKQMNEAKRIVSRNITEAGFNSPSYSVDKIVRSTLQKGVEDGANALGLPDVATINQKMANLIKAQDMLSHIEGKTVKSGMTGELAQTATTAAGAATGAFLGMSPEVSGFIGNRLGSLTGKKLKGVSLGILNRTGKDAERTTLEEGVRGTKGTIRGLLQQGTISQVKKKG